jgi:perosamine synthetase
VVTHDRALAETIRAMRNQGRRPDDGWLDHQLLGFNYRLSELSCALGASQMKRIDSILASRHARAARYCDELRTIPEITPPTLTIPHGRLCWFVFVVRLPDRFQAADRDAVLGYMAERGIAVGATSRRFTSNRFTPPARTAPMTCRSPSRALGALWCCLFLTI